MPRNIPPERSTSWNQNGAVLYVDQPVGTGFSFTSDPEDLSTYATTGSVVSSHLYQMLQDFYSHDLWPRENEFLVRDPLQLHNTAFDESTRHLAFNLESGVAAQSVNLLLCRMAHCWSTQCECTAIITLDK